MTIIKIQAFDNGGHSNQTVFGSEITPPEGWAIVPDDMDTPNFPFGDIEVDESVPPVVTRWVAREIPEPEPDVYIPSEDRLSSLESALAQTDETAIELFEAQEEQTEINNAQDDALIEIYELLEG